MTKGTAVCYCKTLYVREFHKLNKTVKLKDMNINTVPTLTGITHALQLRGLNSTK